MLPFRLALVLACGLPLLAQPVQGRNLLLDPPAPTADEVTALERQLSIDPDNDAVRNRVTTYYFLNAMPTERVRHILWLIEHRPESPMNNFRPFALNRRGLPGLNTTTDFEQGRVLWMRQVERVPNNGAVLLNAARLIGQSHPFEAEKILIRARRIPSVQERATAELVSLYSGAVEAELAAGIPAVYQEPSVDPEFRRHARDLIATTNETIFPGRIGANFARRVRFPPESRPPAEVIEMAQRRNEYGDALLLRAQQLEPTNPEWRVISVNPPSFQPAPQRENLPVVISTVAPIYPPLAAQARIQGLVKFKGIVGPEGTLTNLTLVSGHPLLVQAAQDAARQSRHPDHIGQTVFIEVPFRLQ